MANNNALKCCNNIFFSIISKNDWYNDFKIRDKLKCFHPSSWYSQAEVDFCSVTG